MCICLQFDAYLSCYNDKQSSSICLNIPPASQVRRRKSCFLHRVIHLLLHPAVIQRSGGWIRNPQALFGASALLSHPLSSHPPQGRCAPVPHVPLRRSVLIVNYFHNQSINKSVFLSINAEHYLLPDPQLWGFAAFVVLCDGNWISLGNQQLKDVRMNSGKLWWAIFTIFWHFFGVKNE